MQRTHDYRILLNEFAEEKQNVMFLALKGSLHSNLVWTAVPDRVTLVRSDFLPGTREANQKTGRKVEGGEKWPALAEIHWGDK